MGLLADLFVLLLLCYLQSRTWPPVAHCGPGVELCSHKWRPFAGLKAFSPRSVQIRCQPPPPKKELRQCTLGSLGRQCALGSLDNVGLDPSDNEARKPSHLSSVSSIRICLPPTFQFIHVWSMTIIWKCSINYGVKIASELRSSWASRCTSCRGTTPRRMCPRSRSTEEQKNALAASSLSTPWRGWGVSLRVRSFWASLSLLTFFKLDILRTGEFLTSFQLMITHYFQKFSGFLCG